LNDYQAFSGDIDGKRMDVTIQNDVLIALKKLFGESKRWVEGYICSTISLLGYEL
jgi:hypothetical protein